APGRDISIVNASSLSHHLDIPVHIAESAGEPNVEDFAALVAGRVRISSVGLGKMSIVAGEAGCIRKLSLDPRDTKRLAPAAVVVKGALVQRLNPIAVQTDEFPGTGRVIGPGSIPWLAHVRSITYGHETLQVESELLPTQANLRRSAGYRLGQEQEGLLEIEPVLIDRSENGLPGRKVTLQLHEHLELVSDTKI